MCSIWNIVHLCIFLIQIFDGAVTIKFNKPNETIEAQYDPDLRFNISDTSSGVVLRCPYELEANDVHGLVVKWYYGSNALPIYQWISPLTPQAFRSWKNRIDLSYETSSDSHAQFSSIRLNQVQPNLSGVFKCTVSSYTDERSYSVNLLVYALPSAFEVEVAPTDDERTEISCFSTEIAPRPKLRLYKAVNDKRVLLSSIEEEKMQEDGTYNITLTSYVHDIQLDGMTVFECHLDIADMNISMIESVKYIPRTVPNIYHLYSMNGGTKITISTRLCLYLFWVSLYVGQSLIW